MAAGFFLWPKAKNSPQIILFDFTITYICIANRKNAFCSFPSQKEFVPFPFSIFGEGVRRRRNG
jgi:hypothetical protein